MSFGVGNRMLDDEGVEPAFLRRKGDVELGQKQLEITL